MYIKRILAVLILLSLVGLINPAARTTLPASTYADINGYVQKQMRAWNIPGAALVIVRDGSIDHIQAFGLAGAERPVTIQTPFEIGSCTKSFTALAVMQLVEAGKVRLDAPVQQVLPWFQVASPEHVARITIRHLLNHTSGIPQDISNRMTMINPQRMTLEGQIRAVRSVQLSAAPGTLYQYSNLNYMVLALIIEALSGQTYEAYLSQNVFLPLGMQNSFVDPSIARAHGLSDGHTWWFGMPVPSLEGPRTDMLGAGYLMVSPEDMAHYLIAQLNGGMYANQRVLSASGIERMHTPADLKESSTNYGMGWVRYIDDKQQIINHNGASASFTCSMILLPEQKTGIAVLANVSSLLGPHAAWTMAHHIQNMLTTGEDNRIEEDFQRFYLPWDGGFLFATLAIVGPLVIQVFQRRQLPTHRPNKRKIFMVFVDGILTAAAFFGLPLAVGWAKWRGMLVWQPDAFFWCLAAGFLLLARFTRKIQVFLRRDDQSMEKTR